METKFRLLFGLLAALIVLLSVVYARADARQAKLNRDLVMAIVTDNPTKVQKAFDQGADPNGLLCGMDPDAVWHFQHIKPLLWLLIKVHGQTNYTTPVLTLAASFNQPDCVRLLLKYGANPNIRGQIGQTLLIIAAAFSTVSCVQDLLDSGANAHIVDNQRRTAYNWAAAHGEKRAENAALISKASCGERLVLPTQERRLLA